MPPKHGRSRLPGGGERGTSQHGKTASNGAAEHASTNGAKSRMDTLHNTDQPCCTMLTRIAHSLFPMRSKEDNPSLSSPDPITDEWYQLLLHYMYDARHHEILDPSNYNNCMVTPLKKKRKKKKKKKSTAIILVETDDSSPAVELQESSTSWYDSMEDYGDERTVHCQPHPDAKLSSSLEEKEQRLQHERMRRINQLFHRFLESRERVSSDIPPLQALYAFVATLRDDESCDTSVPTTTGATTRSILKNENAPLTLVTRKQIEQALQNIQCRNCRQDVEDILLPSLSKTKVVFPTQLFLKSLVIPTVYDDDAGDVQVDEDKATQYQSLMEEGRSPPEHLQNWSLDLQVSTGAEVVLGWQVCRPLVRRYGEGSPPDDNRAVDMSTLGWTMSDLEFLLKHYVLLLGLPPDEISPLTTTVSRNDIAEIAAQVAQRSGRITEQFRVMTYQIEDALDTFRTTQSSSSSTTESPIDWHTYNTISDLDQVCCLAMNELLNINLEITRAVHDVCSHWSAQGEPTEARDEAAAECQWALGHCSAMWQAFVEGCMHILRSRQAYEDQLWAMVDERTGSIPDMLSCPAARKLYSSFVESKVVRVIQIMRLMDDQLNGSTYIGGWHNCCSTNIKTTFKIRLYTENIFYSYVVALLPDESASSTTICPAMDGTFEDVMRTVREMTDTVQERTIAIVQQKHQQIRAKLQRLLRKVCDDMDDVEGMALLVFRQELEALQVIDWQGDGGRTVKELESGLNKAIGVWVKYRLDYVVAGKEKLPLPSMPYNLRRSMIKGASLHEESQTCRGGNAQHRAMCILVALFFEKLAEHFQQWQAFRAEQELLTTMESDVDRVASVAAAKVNKKPKKKGKKASGENGKKDLPPNLTPGDAHATPMKAVSTDSDDDPLCPHRKIPGAEAAPNDPPVKVESAIAVMKSLIVDNPEVGGETEVELMHLQELEKFEPTGPNNDRLLANHKFDGSSISELANSPAAKATTTHNPIERDGGDEVESNRSPASSEEIGQGSSSYSRAGVHDASGFVTAEDFFVGRLINIMKSDAVFMIHSGKRK